MGDHSLDKLYPLVYEQIRELAGQYMRRERDGHTLHRTDLANEAFLRLAKSGKATYKDKNHVLGAAARTMRNYLVDYARKLNSKKHGGDWVRVTLVSAVGHSDSKSVDILALDEALSKLDADSNNGPRQVRLIEMRYFGGLTEQEAADQLGISRQTAWKDWRYAQAWLRVELADFGADEKGT